MWCYADGSMLCGAVCSRVVDRASVTSAKLEAIDPGGAWNYVMSLSEVINVPFKGSGSGYGGLNIFHSPSGGQRD